MFKSIVQVVLVPIGLGFVIHKLFADLTEKLVKILPLFSTAAICLIVGSVVSHNAGKILSAGALIFAVVILHNLLGYACGFAIGKALGMSPEKIKAMSIEIGMQNSGLAASLAAGAFPSMPMAAVPGAVFSVWHNISGAVLAQFYRKWKPFQENPPE